MGFLKDLGTVTRQGRDMRRSWDPSAQMELARQQMAAANHVLTSYSEAVAAVTNVVATGMEGTATITAVRSTGLVVNHEPLVELDLLVRLPGRPPYPVTTPASIGPSAMAKAGSGATVGVRVDPSEPDTPFIDWACVPV